ncbi:MAG: acetate/propionate family kinase [Erythrobacter sp.]|uniref:acetate/propionate family kinase n=1 Tax=Erythrobacter sp. TaxID=1042 RepID=UPI001B0991BC|nr:acetate/propionate family kinase [Erythrobacter sp.]MBO6531346.1 acetate/propionate family kinase [Erythrobacter sp.]
MIATFNVGSSSLKFSLFVLTETGGFQDCILRGAVRDLHGDRTVDLEPSDESDALREAILGVVDTSALIQTITQFLIDWREDHSLAAIGHRIVHGGAYYDGPTIAGDEDLTRLDALSVFAPAHQPHNLAGVRALKQSMPNIPQTLSFDTAFHRTMPRIAELYALPRNLSEEGLLRFGFHGLSYAHIAETIPTIRDEMPSRLVALHLGSGASACAMQDGESIATSMGLTALDGLPMATRCGDLDPGVVLHLIQDRGMTPDAVAELLYKKSGLLGVSGLSSDTRALLQDRTGPANEAIDLYCYRIAREVGSLAVALGGLDAIVFSGGVGENAPTIRARIIAHLSWLGVSINQDANRSNRVALSPSYTSVPVYCITADEERIIARECTSLI